MTKGVVGMRLFTWRMMTQDAMAHHGQMQAALEAQMQAQGAGLRQLRQILARMVKGEVGMRVEIWRTAMKDDVRADEMARLRRDLEASLADTSAGAALRRLRQIFARNMRGELGLRLEVCSTLLRATSVCCRMVVASDVCATLLNDTGILRCGELL